VFAEYYALESQVSAWLTARLAERKQGDLYSEGAAHFGITRDKFKQLAYRTMYTNPQPQRLGDVIVEPYSPIDAHDPLTVLLMQDLMDPAPVVSADMAVLEARVLAQKESK
jgi:hypothetical protein